MPINNGNISNNGGSGGGGDNQFIYRGTYNASNNTVVATGEHLFNGVGTQGDWYLVVTAGSVNPTDTYLAVNQVMAYNGVIYESGGQIDNTDELAVASNYIIVHGQTIQVGQILTVSLGVLEGQIADLATSLTAALNNKQNLVTGATDKLASFNASGQIESSGIAKADVTTQGNTFNAANKLAQLDANTALVGAISSGLTQVNAGTGYTGALNAVLTNIISAINSGGIGLNGTVFVSKLGNDITGNGTLGNPYLTVTKGMTQAIAGQIVLVDKGTYDEDVTQKASVALLGTTRLNTVIRSLTINTAGTFDVQNLSLQRSTAGDTLLVSGTGVVNLQARNVSISASGLATNVINWTNSGTGSKGEFIMGIASSGLATIPVWNSTTTSKGTITNFYMTYRNSVNPDADCLLLNGAMAFNHTFDGTQGRVVVANTSSYIGTLLTMITGTVAALTTNSSAISSLNLVSVTTSKINVVDGAGGFAVGIVGFLGTGYGFANTLNGGAGAIVGEQSPIRFDPSPLLPTIQAGLVQSDGTNLYYDNTIRNKIMFNPMTAVGDITIGGAAGSPARLAKGTVGQILTSQTTGIAWMDNPAYYLYTKYRYVDNVNGLDTNNGSYNSPYKTMLYSVTNNPTGTIHVLMGQSTEAAFSIPANKTNIDIIAQGTRSALNGFTNKVTVLGTGAGSVRFQDLNFGGGLTRDATCTCGIYVYDGSIGAAGFTQSGNGYTEFSQTDASNGVNTISAGTFNFFGGKMVVPTITGTGTTVSLDNVGAVVGNGTLAAGCTLYVFETNWIAAATGHAITAAAGSVTTMQGCNFIRPNGTLASVSLTNYDIQNTDFDRASSVLGTHIGNYDWYAKLGLLNADTITTATKMLVRKPTGEIAEQLISGGSTQRSSLYLAGYGAASPVQNGNLDFSDSSSVSSVGTGVTYAGVNISLEAGKNYNVTTMLNSIQAGVPDASRKIISYSGATTSGNNFAFDNTNMTATNGSITNNVYVTAVALPVGTNGAVAPTVAYDTNGSINLLIPSATISPYQCVLYSGSTANNWSIYGQAAYSANALLTLNAGALTVAAVNRVDTQGGTFGSGELEFTHPYTGVNPTEYAACAAYGISVVSESLSSTRFAYKKGGNAFVLQATAFTNSVVMNGSLTACYSPTLDVAVFVGTSAVSAQINLTTGAFVQTTFGTQGCVQINRGLLTGVETFVGVGSTTNPLTIRKSTDGSIWTALAANNLTAILPTTGTTGTPIYSISGICQTLDGENAWLVAVNDTVNNICHICTSSGLLIFQKIKSYYGFNVTGLLSLQFGGTTGTSNVGGSSAVVGASSNTTGAGNIVIYNKGYYGTESSWLTVTNPTVTTTQAIRFGVSPSGMIYVWNAQNGTAVAYSNNGGSSYTTTTLGTAFTYLMPYADFKIISGSTTSASRQYNASYRWNYGGGTYIPKAVWLNSQKLQAGVNSSTSIVLTDIIPSAYVVNFDGTVTITGAPLSIVGSNNRYFKVGVSSLNSYEKVSYLSGSVFAVSNTFLYQITGTNCTVATTTQAPGLQGNVQTSVQAQVTNVTANATIQLNSSYNSGTNTLGGGNSILVTEI